MQGSHYYTLDLTTDNLEPSILYCFIPVTFNTSFTPKAIQVLFFEGHLPFSSINNIDEPHSPLEYHPRSTFTPARAIDRNNFRPCLNKKTNISVNIY